MKVLIVEDELIAAEFLREIVEKAGAEVVDIVDTGKESIRQCVKLQPDIVFMDIMLRDNVSGSEAAVEISRRCDTAIVFVTAYSDAEMIDYAVISKAEAYLTKPYNETEIVATLRLIQARRKERRRANESASNFAVQKHEIALVDGFVYRTDLNKLLRNGKEVRLSKKALKVIELLAKRPDVSVSNEAIMAYVWGERVNEKTLRSMMFRIRASTSDRLIENVSGVGYMLKAAFKG